MQKIFNEKKRKKNGEKNQTGQIQHVLVLVGVVKKNVDEGRKVVAEHVECSRYYHVIRVLQTHISTHVRTHVRHI